MQYSLKNDLCKFLIIFFVYFAFASLLRLTTTSDVVVWGMLNGYTFSFALLFALVCLLYNFKRYNLFLYIAFIALYLVAMYCKYFAKSVISEREILYTIGTGTFLYAVPAVFLYISGCIRSNCLRKILTVLSLVLFILSILPAFLYIGYFFASGKHLLEADSLLAIFQTNFSEIKAYLLEQNIALWSLLSFFILLILSALSVLFLKLRTPHPNFKILGVSVVFLIYFITSVFFKLNQCFLLNLSGGVYETLQSFKEYEKNKEERFKRLESLKNILNTNQTDGLYILVMGESLTRAHMSAFGYPKQTTPWLDEKLNKEGTVIFKNAYSNHSHTVPSIQYAFSSQNQYNGLDLSKAYSITEIARAAGFDVYWISNQQKFVKNDIPLAVMAQAANHQKFINEHVGATVMTTYYDDKLAEYFPKIENGRKSLIIFHLMGNHAVYKDRYPKSFAQFKSSKAKVDEYDNAVLYGDYVLSKLYKKAEEHPDFMGFIFLSDHGEDPDNGLAHDSSKFTYQMAQIPLVMIFSNQWLEKNQQTFDALKANQDAYWTSDLLYDCLVNIFGIQNVPNTEDRFDISSPSYNMPYEELKTLHGRKYIKDEKKAVQ